MHIGDDFFGNVNLTFVDDVEIRIGDGVMIAPGVTLTTTGHPIHPDRRVDFRRFSEPIVITDDDLHTRDRPSFFAGRASISRRNTSRCKTRSTSSTSMTSAVT